MHNKKKALLIDFGNHYKQIKHCLHLWNFMDVDCICEQGELANYKEVVSCQILTPPSFVTNKTFSSIYLILMIIFKSNRYDRLIVLTGMEYISSTKGILKNLLWLIACQCFKNRFFLYIKNSDVYLPTPRIGVTENLRRMLMKASANKAKALCFESEQQKKYFISRSNIRNKKNIVLYTYYSDIERSNIGNASENEIGMIGQFDTSRRNYKVLLESISFLKENKISIWQIGRFIKTPLSLNIYKKIKDVVHIEMKEFTDTELSKSLDKCCFLISLNSSARDYGLGKGTAAFGEAISKRKVVVIPSFVDIDKEFSDFTVYFEENNTKSFIQALEKAKQISKINNFEKVFLKFTSEKIREKLIREIG